MQLTPRQYQIDPTGGAYVQDTRPLLAAMGAQAAAQLESDKLMQQTIQQGVKGVENFAARRQLAAARAQLSGLQMEDPDYGVKLSEIVLDNPLAFTNEKTAPVASIAFKQATDTYSSRMRRQERLEDTYNAYLYQRDLATQRNQGSSAFNRPGMKAIEMEAETEKQIYTQQYQQAATKIKELESQKSYITGDARQVLDEEIARERANLDSLQREYRNRTSGYANQMESMISQGTGSEMSPPLPAPAGVVNTVPIPEGVETPVLPPARSTVASGQRKDFDPTPLPVMGETADTDTMGPESLLFPYEGQDFETPAGPAFSPEGSTAPIEPPAWQGPVQVAQPPPTPEPAPTPAAPSQDQSAVDMVKRAQALTELDQQRVWKNTSPEQKRLTVSNLISIDPELTQKNAELLQAKASLANIKARIDSQRGNPAADLPALLDQQGAALTAIANLESATNARSARVSLEYLNSGNPYSVYDKRMAAAAIPPAEPPDWQGPIQEELPPPPVPLSASARAAADLKAREMQQQSVAQEETNQQWTEAKSNIVQQLGGPEEVGKILRSVMDANVLGVSLTGRKMRLKNALKTRLQSLDTTAEGFETLFLNQPAFQQKMERRGSQKVTNEEVVDALVEQLMGEMTGANAANIPTEPISLGAPGTSTPR